MPAGPVSVGTPGSGASARPADVLSGGRDEPPARSRRWVRLAAGLAVGLPLGYAALAGPAGLPGPARARLEVVPPAVTTSPGGAAHFALRLHNGGSAPARLTAVLLDGRPVGAQAARVPPGTTRTLARALPCPARVGRGPLPMLSVRFTGGRADSLAYRVGAADWTAYCRVHLFHDWDTRPPVRGRLLVRNDLSTAAVVSLCGEPACPDRRRLPAGGVARLGVFEPAGSSRLRLSVLLPGPARRCLTVPLPVRIPVALSVRTSRSSPSGC